MPQTTLSIDGERAAVTAAGSGIGREIATQLCEAGLDVAVNDVDGAALDDTAAALSDAPGEVLTSRGDAADPADMRAFVDEAAAAFGGLDVLVNNVGIAGPTEPAESISHEAFMQTLRVNVGGQFAATKAAIPHLKASDAGRVINLSSISGKRPLENRTPYTSSKMAVIGFTRTLAVELAPHGVTVNAICPGNVDGPRLEAVIRGQAESREIPYETAEEEFLTDSPMRELVDAADVAGLVMYLCSERGERITGQDLNVSAGAMMH